MVSARFGKVEIVPLRRVGLMERKVVRVETRAEPPPPANGETSTSWDTYHSIGLEYT